MKRALLIGIDHYDFGLLNGCVEDAKQMKNLLSKHYDKSRNFYCKSMLSTAGKKELTRMNILREIRELFQQKGDVALLYASSHGTSDDIFGGYLVTQDANKEEPGVAVSQILDLMKNANVKETIVILDCCNSGSFANIMDSKMSLSILPEGACILTSSGSNEASIAKGGRGLFTKIIEQALNGGSSDILGNTTIGSIYNYADQLLGAWDQRPQFKANISRMLSLRNCKPKIEIDTVLRIPEFFETAEHKFKLGPEYEPTLKPKDTKKQEIFDKLQALEGVNLVEPVGTKHMYFAAEKSKYCQLTLLGQFYWKLVHEGHI